MAEDCCIVELTSGRIKGTITRLPDDAGECYSFRGVPYAVPPAGPLRFRSPQPLTTHSQRMLDCTEERAVSLASSYLPPDTRNASEDCLYLNVYTPINPASTKPPPAVLPVMVWLHGGAFCTGSGDSSIYNPEWLVARNVIVVTVNYRLGPAGFLCLPSAGVDGNMGLKDQRMALRWVQTHIGRFGGDAGNVTLFGESAGGVSAHLHSLSEESRSLFQKVICQSGVATSPITFQRDPESKTRRLAEYFGCPADASDSEILETLMNVKPELLAKSQKEALTPHEKTLDSMYPFRPVIERLDSIDPIVTEPVLDLFRRRNRTTTIEPMIIGVTNEEALYKINTFRQHLQRYKDDPCRFIPDSLNVPSEERSEVAQRIVQFYCGADGVCLGKELQLSRIFTDVFYLIPAVQTAEMLLDNQQGPIYFYNFAADTELNKFRQLWKVPKEHRGASHADDVCYLFGSSFFRTDAIGKETEAWKLRDAMCRMWTDFAKTGVPQLEEGGELEWTPLQKPEPGKSLNLSVLEIGSKISMVQNHLPERVGFWRDLFMKYNNCA